MATLSVIYRIAADISNLEQNVGKGVQTMERMETGVAKIGRAIAGAFTVQQVVAFTNELIRSADRIQRLSDVTGISVSGIQDLDHAAQEAGNTLEQVTTAISQMQNRLASGDDSAVSAVRALGLNLRELRELAPDEQFIEIAHAIAQIEDPAVRTQVAMDIFGRSGAIILPLLRSNIRDVADAYVRMKDDTVSSLDAAGDSLGRYWTNFRSVAANVLATAENIRRTLTNVPAGIVLDWARAAAEAARLISGSRPDVPKGPSFGIEPPSISPQEEKRLIAEMNDKLREGNQAREHAAEAQRKWNEQLRDFRNFIGLREIEDYQRQQEAAARQIEENVALEFALNQMYRENAAALGGYADNVGLFARQWVAIGQLAPGIVRNITDSGRALERGRGIGDSLKSLLSVDFKTVSKDLGGFFKGGLKDVGTGFLESIGSGIFNALSGLAMKGLGALGKQVGKLFGIDREHEKVNDLRDAFEDTFGSLHDMNAAFQKVGLTVDRVLSAKKVKDFEAAVAEFNRRLELQHTAWSKVNAAIERYGFTLEQLGPALQRQKLTETALQLYEDFMLLTGAGMDVETVLRGMSTKINEFVQLAIDMGMQIDPSMRPMIERMIELGLLVDANGQLITDLEGSGIQFATSVSDAFLQVADQLREMVELLRAFLGIAQNPPDWSGWVPPVPGVPTHPGGGTTDPVTGIDLPGFASGTGGRFVDFGAGTLAMLHGREAVVPYGQSLGGGVVVNINGGTFDTPAARIEMAERVNQSVMEALRREQRLNAA
jgi:hypothetical protein